MTVVTMGRGTSVLLTVIPTIQGQPGGTLPGVVTWSNNASAIPLNVVMTPNGTTCLIQVPSTTSNGGSFTVNVTSGSLLANIGINVVQPPADGMLITAGAVTTP